MSNKKFLFLTGIVLAMNANAAERSVAVSSAELNVTKAKTDVLGRHNSKVRNSPQAYVKTTRPMVLAKENSTLPNPNTVSIRKTKGAFEFKVNSKGTVVKKYFLNDAEYTEAQYTSLIQSIEDNDAPRKAFKNYYINDYKNNIDNISNKSKDYSSISVERTTDDCSGKESCLLQHVNTGCITGDPIYCASSDKIYDDINLYNYATVVNNSNLYKYLISGGKKGLNIGISFTENSVPLSNLGVDYELLANCSNGSPGNIEHGTKVARTIKTIVPRATLYGLTTLCATADIPVVVPIDGYDKVPKIYIGNHSYGDGVDSYDQSKSRFIDDFVYNTRTIEIASAGNLGRKNGGQISQVARGVNVISVGAVHNDSTYHQTSSWLNPHYPNSGAEYVKPEIANFSDLLFPNADVFNLKKGKSTKKIAPYFYQTSSASPYTTATVALLLDKYPFYRWHPEVVKALLLTSSVQSITGAANHDKDNESSKAAMGVPEGRALAQFNRSRFWNGNNGDHFVDGKIEFYETDIKKNKKYRIAIAWLSSGEDVVKYGKLPQDINLYVYQGNVLKGSSYSKSNPFEMVEINTYNDNNNLRIVITRKQGNNENLGGRVLLGYNLVEIQ